MKKNIVLTLSVVLMACLVYALANDSGEVVSLAGSSANVQSDDGVEEPNRLLGGSADGDAPRVPSPRLSKVTVVVKSSPGAQFVPLVSGRITIRVGSTASEVGVIDGVARVDLNGSTGGFKCLSAVAESYTHLYVSSVPVEDDMHIECFGYEGYFLDVEVGDQGGEENVSVYTTVESQASLRLMAQPPSLEGLKEIPVFGRTPAYVEALRGGSEFMYIRTASSAWRRIDKSELILGSVNKIQLPVGGGVILVGEPQYVDGRVARLAVQVDKKLIMIPKLNEFLGRTIDGWEPGKYSAHLTLSQSASDRKNIGGEVEFEVRPGEVTNVYISGAEALQSENGELMGSLSFDSWEFVEPWFGSSGVTLRIEAKDQSGETARNAKAVNKRYINSSGMTEVRGVSSGSPFWNWDAGTYPAGEYRLFVEPTQWMFDITVNPNEANAIDIVVPPLACTLLDFGSAKVDPKDVTLSLYETIHGQKKLGRELPQSLIAAEGGGLQMISPPGKYLMWFVYKGESYERNLELLAGWNNESIAVSSGGLATIDLVDKDGNPYELKPSEWQKIEVKSSAGLVGKLNCVYVNYGVDAGGGFSRAQVVIEDSDQFELFGFDNCGVKATPKTVVLEDGKSASVLVEKLR
jgi:hypothetical protein